MKTSSENINSLWVLVSVWTSSEKLTELFSSFEIRGWGVNLSSKLAGDSGSKLGGNSGSKREGDAGSKLEGDGGNLRSKLEE